MKYSFLLTLLYLCKITVQTEKSEINAEKMEYFTSDPSFCKTNNEINDEQGTNIIKMRSDLIGKDKKEIIEWNTGGQKEEKFLKLWDLNDLRVFPYVRDAKDRIISIKNFKNIVNKEAFPKFVDCGYMLIDEDPDDDLEQSYFLFFVVMDFSKSFGKEEQIEFRNNSEEFRFYNYEVLLEGLETIHGTNKVFVNLNDFNFVVGENKNLKLWNFNLGDIGEELTLKKSLFHHPEYLNNNKILDEKFDVHSLLMVFIFLEWNNAFYHSIYSNSECKDNFDQNCLDIIYFQIVKNYEILEGNALKTKIYNNYGTMSFSKPKESDFLKTLIQPDDKEAINDRVEYYKKVRENYRNESSTEVKDIVSVFFIALGITYEDTFSAGEVKMLFNKLNTYIEANKSSGGMFSSISFLKI